MILSLSLDKQHMAVLQILAAEQEISKTSVLRQALRLYQAVHEHTQKGEQLAFIKDGKVVPLILPSRMPWELG